MSSPIPRCMIIDYDDSPIWMPPELYGKFNPCVVRVNNPTTSSSLVSEQNGRMLVQDDLELPIFIMLVAILVALLTISYGVRKISAALADTSKEDEP